MSLRKKLIAATAIAGAALGLFSGTASAYDGKWYFGVGAGWETMDDDWLPAGSSVDDGWIGDGRIGFEPSNSSFRHEFDVSYRTNDISDSRGGEVDIWSAMYDVIWDFQTDSSFTPYIGAGAGWGWAELSVPIAAVDDRDNGLAGQLIAGVGIALAPNMTLDIEYRYMGLFDTTFDGFDESLSNHSVLAGLRWTFGEAAAPIVFKIFFPWDVFTLTQEAQNTVDEIAAQYKDQKISRILISGNTDTSGTGDYNMGLGAKRADSVKVRLIAQGIPESVISTETLGETNPAVQTGDNVREPLNRRAEVVIQLQ